MPMSGAISPSGPRRGEIWKGYTPGQPDDPHQPRFLLVLSLDVRNRSTDDIIAIPIFTRGALGPPRVPITAGEGGIPHDSVLFCDEITTIDRDFLESGPLGPPVSDDLLLQVVLAVHNAIAP
jgi:mRNA-degrading endonuclease toxin of MazEF toxin-antitoxin module